MRSYVRTRLTLLKWRGTKSLRGGRSGFSNSADRTKRLLAVDVLRSYRFSSYRRVVRFGTGGTDNFHHVLGNPARLPANVRLHFTRKTGHSRLANEALLRFACAAARGFAVTSASPSGLLQPTPGSLHVEQAITW